MKYFSDKEIIKAGSHPSLIKLKQKVAMDGFAGELKSKYGKVYIMLLFNGLTSGGHASPEHPNGEACDFYIVNKSGKQIPVNKVVQMAMKWFNGVGAYWNGIAWSFHADTGYRVRNWCWDRTKHPAIKSSVFCNKVGESLI
jgi:hypothetical protein